MEKNTPTNTPLANKRERERVDVSPSSLEIISLTRQLASLEAQAKELIALKKEQTGVVGGVGDWIGEKTGMYETGKDIYQKSLSDIISKVTEVQSKITTLLGSELSEKERGDALKLTSKAQSLAAMKLGEVRWADAVVGNKFQDGVSTRSQNESPLHSKVQGVAAGVEGVARSVVAGAEGVYDGVSGVVEITGKAIGMAAAWGLKDGVSEVIGNDLSELMKVMTRENAEKLLAALPGALEEFKKLPPNEQAEKAAYLVGMIAAPLGVGGKIAQLGKAQMALGRTGVQKGTDTVARAMDITKRQATRTSGPSTQALSVAQKAAVAGVASMAMGATNVAVGGTTVAAGTAVRFVGEMGANSGQTKLAKAAAQSEELSAKMVRAEARSGVSPEMVLKNSNLSPEARLSTSKELLGRELTADQNKAILHVHENISKGVYKNEYGDLRAMLEEMDKAGFSRDESRKLMENGVLGNGDEVVRNIANSPNASLDTLEEILRESDDPEIKKLALRNLINRFHDIQDDFITKTIFEQVDEMNFDNLFRKTHPLQNFSVDQQMDNTRRMVNTHGKEYLMRLRQNAIATMDKVHAGDSYIKVQAIDHISENFYHGFPADGTILSTNHGLFTEWRLPREFYEKHFRILSADTSDEVRRRVAYKTRNHEGDYFRELEKSMSQDGSAQVRRSLIGKFTDESILRKFLGDPDEGVKNSAAEELKSRVTTR